MDYAVIACFEPEGDWNVRRLMRHLAENGVNDLYESFGFRPHITLTEFSTDDFSKVEQKLDELVTMLQPVDIRLTSLGLFPGAQGVFYLVPTVNDKLLEIHRLVQRMLEPLCQDFSPLYQEPEWVPHCTLVLEMDPLELPRAYETMLQYFQPIRTRLVALEVITCCPFRTVYSKTLVNL